jgi:DNA-binding CsgD family transcriptional regulator
VRRSTQIPLVARHPEIAGFRRALADAAVGHPGVLVIGGDAGVGKTRLVNHLATVAREAGAHVVVAHCVDLGDVGIPYLPFTEALGLLRDGENGTGVAHLVAERPALARLLDPATSPLPDAHAERLPLLDGIVGTLAAAGRPGAPLVLVVEDVHWADPSTRDVLRFLATRLRSEHLLLVATYRSDDVDRRHPLRPLLAELHRLEQVEHVELAPFTSDELREFTTAVNDGPLTEAEFGAVLRRSEGNAFFAEELLSAGPAASLPWTLADILHARLTRLRPEVQQIVRLASVAGRQVREDLLLAAAARVPALADPATATTALRDAVTQQVLTVEQQHLAFRHALLAEALYLDLLPGERASTHRAYLAALTADPTLGSPAERAHHALQGHDLPTALAASFDAAASAQGLLAPTEQLRHLEQVLSLWESVDDAAGLVGVDRVTVALDAAAAANRQGHLTRAVQLARRAVDALDADPRRQASVRHVLARYLHDLDDLDAAAAQADLALTVLDIPLQEAGDAAELAAALAVRGRIELSRDEDDAARTFLERAVDVARDAGAPEAEADALASLAIIEVDDPQTAARLTRTALERARDVGSLSTEIRSWASLVVTYFYAGRLDEAADVLTQGLERTRETATIRSPDGIWMQQLDAIVRYTRGDLTPTEVPVGIPASDATLLTAARQYAAVARGDADVLDRAAELREQWDAEGFVALVAAGCHVDALTWAGRYDDAVEVAAEVVDHLGAIWSTYFLGRNWIAALALAALAGAAEEPRASGSTGADERRRRADELLEVARATADRGRPRGGNLGPEGQAWLCRAEAEHARFVAADGGKPADPVLWETTVAAFDYGYRYEVARSRLRWAQALHAAGDTDAAAGQTLQALAEAEAMGAVPLAEAAAAWARRSRVTVPGVHRDTSVLTGREAEVLTLVAQGLSNGKIGAHLFISTKTVSVHVSNILAKLGVSGRAEAVAVAARRGLLPD